MTIGTALRWGCGVDKSWPLEQFKPNPVQDGDVRDVRAGSYPVLFWHGRSQDQGRGGPPGTGINWQP